jgi:hypothetical protein
MNWNYIGIDSDPPAGKIMILTSSGDVIQGTRVTPNIVAWHPLLLTSAVKAHCQVILRGLPELRMVACICKNPKLLCELETAVLHYHDDQLADFTDLIRTLDSQAHHDGVPCIPNFHN